MKPLAFVPFLLSVVACSDAPPEDAALLAIGDSLLDFNRPDEDIATVMADALSITHAFGAEGGTTLMGDEGYAIPDQYVRGDYELLLVSGGGNDLGEGCVCGDNCDPIVDQLVSDDGTYGVARDLVDRAIDDGLQVVWVGYMRPMADAEEFSTCGGELDILRSRMAQMDNELTDMVFVDGVTIGDGSDASLYAPDGYHPSTAGSAALGLEAATRASDAFGL
mgnify:CR=1 FL=1